MLPMTSTPGSPDKNMAKPGMAYFEGTGPVGKTCGDCNHRGYYQEGKPRWDPARNTTVTDRRRVQKCVMFRKLSGGHDSGGPVNRNWRACKYFEQKEKQK